MVTFLPSNEQGYAANVFALRHATVVVMAVLAIPRFAQADFVVSSGIFRVGVVNSANSTNNVHTLSQIENPWSASHSASLGISFAAASYDFAWSPAGGSFLISGSNAAAGNPVNLFSACEGSIIIETTSPYLLNLEGLYNYQLASGDREARLNIRVRDVTLGQSLYSHTSTARPITGDPATGTFQQMQELTLTPGHRFSLSYFMALDSYSGNPNVVSTGDGFVQFTLTAIPEPASAALVALGLPRLRRRAR